MRKAFAALMIFIVMLTAAGCSSIPQEVQEPVTYYYRVRDLDYSNQNGVIRSEIREAYGHTEDFTYLLEQYLRGPMDEQCISPFPAGTTLIHLDFLKDTVLVELSSHISLLSGSDLSIACTCLAKTMIEITGMKEVKITSQGDYLDGMESITISESSFDLVDKYATN